MIGAGLWACSSVQHIEVESELLEIKAKNGKQNEITQIINPYRDSLEDEMNKIIAYAPKTFIKSRPNGSLNNWATDVVLNSQKEKLDLSGLFFCLLNYGGLRSPINQGGVTVGDIFKLMPFDNEIVIVTLPVTVLKEIGVYLKERGGEPIAGVKLINDKLIFEGKEINDFYQVQIITSDYLMNGGDNMTFFDKKTDVYYTGKLMRDVMIEEARKQDTLIWTDEQRIIFE